MMMNMQKTDESRLAPPQPDPIRLGAVTLGAPVFLARDQWELNYTQQRETGLKFTATRERA